MTWTIERGAYESHPVTRTPLEVSRVWRMHPPPWKLVFTTADHELAEVIVNAHNEDVATAGETPQLGIIPRRTIARALQRLLEVEPEPYTVQERRWVENHVRWLEEEPR